MFTFLWTFFLATQVLASKGPTEAALAKNLTKPQCQEYLLRLNLKQNPTVPEPWRSQIITVHKNIVPDLFVPHLKGLSKKTEIDALTERVLAGDQHTLRLLTVGLELPHLTSNPMTIPLRYNERIQKLIARQMLQKEQAIFAGLIFRDTKASDDASPERKYIAMPIDQNLSQSWPDGKRYRLVLGLSEEFFSHEEWQYFVGRLGILPFSPGFYFEHSLGHMGSLTPNLQSETQNNFRDLALDEMKAMRSYYQQSDLLSKSFSQQLSNYAFRTLRGGESVLLKNRYKRIFYVGECSSVVDVTQKELIQKLIPQFFNRPISNLDENREYLKNLRIMQPEVYRDHIFNILKNREAIIFRVGGMAGDPYNLFSRTLPDAKELNLEIFDQSLQNFNSEALLKRRWTRSAMKESPLGMAKDLTLLMQMRYDWNKWIQTQEGKRLTLSKNQSRNLAPLKPEVRNKKLDAKILDLLNRLEVSFFTGLALDMTPADFFYDITPIEIPDDAKIVRYHQAFVDPHGVLAEIFVEKSARVLDSKTTELLKNSARAPF